MDDLGFGDVGPTAGQADATPNIDRVANKDTVLTDYPRRQVWPRRAPSRPLPNPYRLAQGAIRQNDNLGLPLTEMPPFSGKPGIGGYSRLMSSRPSEARHSQPNSLTCSTARPALRQSYFTDEALLSVLDTDTGKWWALTGSNRRPSRCKRDALPTELSALAMPVCVRCQSLGLRASPQTRPSPARRIAPT